MDQLKRIQNPPRPAPLLPPTKSRPTRPTRSRSCPDSIPRVKLVPLGAQFLREQNAHCEKQIHQARRRSRVIFAPLSFLAPPGPPARRATWPKIPPSLCVWIRAMTWSSSKGPESKSATTNNALLKKLDAAARAKYKMPLTTIPGETVHYRVQPWPGPRSSFRKTPRRWQLNSAASSE